MKPLKLKYEDLKSKDHITQLLRDHTAEQGEDINDPLVKRERGSIKMNEFTKIYNHRYEKMIKLWEDNGIFLSFRKEDPIHCSYTNGWNDAVSACAALMRKNNITKSKELLDLLEYDEDEE